MRNGKAQAALIQAGKLLRDLKNLSIPNSNEPDTKVTAKKDFKKLANGYPALDVIAENFQLGNKNLGSLGA